MPFTYNPKKTGVRRCTDGRWRVLTKEQGPTVDGDPSRVLCGDSAGYEKEEEALAAFHAFLSSREPVYTTS
jgi:hypothetical protein